MKARIIIILILFAAINISYSQETAYRMSIGIGSYSMKDFKNQIEDSKQYMPVEAKTLNNFPPFLNYHAALRFYSKRRQIYFEPEFAFYSTGCRLDYRDYSGELTIDFETIAFAFSLKSGTYFGPVKKFNFGIYEQISSYFTTYKIKEKVRLYDESASSSAQVRYTSMGVEAGFLGRYVLNGRFDILSSIGYYQQIYTFKNFHRNPDWSGLRFEIGIIYKLLTKKDKE